MCFLTNVEKKNETENKSPIKEEISKIQLELEVKKPVEPELPVVKPNHNNFPEKANMLPQNYLQPLINVQQQMHAPPPQVIPQPNYFYQPQSIIQQQPPQPVFYYYPQQLPQNQYMAPQVLLSQPPQAPTMLTMQPPTTLINPLNSFQMQSPQPQYFPYVPYNQMQPTAAPTIMSSQYQKDNN